MDDNLLQLAFSIYHKPRVYALLLGSGVSRSAGIPTGWAIMETLIRQIADVRKEQVEGEPYDWYKEQYGEEPTYAKLLKKLGAKPSNRDALLRRFFRPTDDEPDGKQPTSAHRAIAKLMKAGYIELVLTTNFDTLLETALEDEHLEPYVIRSSTKAAGAEPLGRHPYTIIKLHGDYVDGEMLNTPEELGAYSEAMSDLLHRALSDYGLIVCGWSAENDKALHDSMLAVPSRHFTTYWTQYGDSLLPAADEIIKHRQAEVIQINDANGFFIQLEDAVSALQKSFSHHPLSIPVAVERVKRMLPNPQAHIELEELLREEIERTYANINSPSFYTWLDNELATGLTSAFANCLDRYMSEMERALHIAATVCWYGEDRYSQLIKNSMSRLSEGRLLHRDMPLGYLPIIMFMYVAGTASARQQTWQYFQAIISDQTLRTSQRMTYQEESERFIQTMADEVFLFFVQQGSELSDLLQPRLRSIFANLMPSDIDYTNAFDLFEMLMSMAYTAAGTGYSVREWIPPHQATYKSRSWDYLKRFWQTGGKQRDAWGLVHIEPFQSASITDLLTKYVKIARSFQESKIGRSPRVLVPDYAKIYLDETGVDNMMRQAPVKGREHLDGGEYSRS